MELERDGGGSGGAEWRMDFVCMQLDVDNCVPCGGAVGGMELRLYYCSLLPW